MTEEKLRRHIGHTDPFRTPEGYFDTFAARLQSRLEAEQLTTKERKPTRIVNLRPHSWFYAAASIVIVAAVGLSLMIPRWRGGNAEMAISEQTAFITEDYDEGYMNAELDYAMIDNSEIAYYLTEGNY